MSYKYVIGPLHPALEEPIKFEFSVNGEEIEDVKVSVSHVHRGIEILGTKRNVIRTLYLAERICGICSAAHAFTFCICVEKACNINIGEREHAIRCIIAELERIHSHLLWAALFMHKMGFETMFHYILLFRENIMDTLEAISGNRVNYGMFTIGGVRKDVKERIILDSIKFIRKKIGFIKDGILKNKIVKKRCINVGILEKEKALKLCSVGPTARASGIDRDIRRSFKYSFYENIEIDPIVCDEGDVYARIIVRLEEVEQSLNILNKIVKNIPKGNIKKVKVPSILNIIKSIDSESVARIEAPRGELLHYVNLKCSENLYTWKVRTPTYNNIMAYTEMFRGAEIADAPIILASIDPCLSCTNRMIVKK